jgi:hypothetical protein
MDKSRLSVRCCRREADSTDILLGHPCLTIVMQNFKLALVNATQLLAMEQVTMHQLMINFFVMAPNLCLREATDYSSQDDLAW